MSSAVVISGATGVVGLDVIDQVLAAGGHEVIALVRAPDRAAAAERIAVSLAKFYDDPRPLLGRITALPADVEAPGLGLSPRDRDEVVKRGSQLLHCAASISFDQPLEESRAINVAGTKRMLDLAHEIAAAGGLERMVHVSTAFVAGAHAGWFEEEDAFAAPPRNSYEESKREAEALVQAARAEGLPVAIARPSVIVGEAGSGWTLAFNAFYAPLRLMSRRIDLDHAPLAPGSLLDVVPADYVARGIFTMLTSDEIPPVVALVAGEDAATLGEIVKLGAAYMDLPVPSMFLSGVQLEGVESLTSYFDVQTRFGNRNARALLEPLGISAPALPSYFTKLLDYAERMRFGKRAITREQARSEAEELVG